MAEDKNKKEGWQNRDNLKGSTICTLVAELDNSEVFGSVKADDEIPYPVTAIDVMYVMEYIRDNGYIGMVEDLHKKSTKTVQDERREHINPKLITQIPFPSKRPNGVKPTIHLELEVVKWGQDRYKIYGDLTAHYQSESYHVLQFNQYI